MSKHQTHNAPDVGQASSLSPRASSPRTKTCSGWKPALLRASAEPRALCILVLCLLAGNVGAAQSVVLFLKSGDRLTGTVTAQDTNRLVLSNAWAAALAIPLAEISRRETNAPAAVLTSALATNRLAATNTAAAKPKPAKHWTGEIQAGTDLALSRVNRQLYTGRAKAVYSDGPFRSAFDALFSYGRTETKTPAGGTESVLSANRLDGSNKTDYELTRQFYLYNLAGAGYDQVRKIEARYEVGPGVGYRWLKSPTLSLKTEYGLNYQAQYFTDTEAVESVYHRLAEDAAWKINSKFSLDEKLEYFPKVPEFNQFRLRLEANLRYWLYTNLSFNVTVLNLYDTHPASNVSPNDLQVRSSIGWKF